MAIGEKTKIKVNIVAYIVLGLALSYAMATQVLSVLQDRFSVYAEFPDAGGVFTNQEVTYRGITIGQVGDMKVTEDGVSIELLIDSGEKVPADGIEARVMFKSAVGEQFIDLLPTSDDPPYLEDGDKIPMAQTSIPVSTQELLAALEGVLRGVPPEALKGAVDALGLGLSGRGNDLATIIESSADLAEVFAERAPEVEGILKSGTKVGGAFLDSKKDFETAIEQLVTVSESLSNSTGNLQRLMENTNLTSDQLVALIRDNRAELNQFLVDFGVINDFQANHADDINRLLVQLPGALGNINSAFETDTGLVRFGLVQDDSQAACNYDTKRRPPEDRSKDLPPKNARCGPGGDQAAQPSADDSPDSTSGTESAIPGLDLGGVSDGLLPSQLSNWSWTLFYLNGF